MVGAAHVVHRRGNVDTQIAAPEPDSRVGRSWFQRQVDFVARVKPDTGTGYLASKCPLKGHRRLDGSADEATETEAIRIPEPSTRPINI
jgi:hypothetical protein